MEAITPSIRQAKALILLYPLTKDIPASESIVKTGTDDIFFVRQTIENACGTIALLHALTNNQPLIQDESLIHQFQEKTKPLGSLERAEWLEKRSDDIKEWHSKFSALGQTEAPEAEEDVNLHFVCFIQVNGLLYELDGRKEGPVEHGPIDNGLFDACAKAIKSVYLENAEEGNFSAVVLVPSNGNGSTI